MTIDTRLPAQLTAAVDDTTVPPGLAQSALAGGRSRRRRRALGGLAAVTAAVVGGVLLLPDTGPSARDVQPAQGRTSTVAALAWARSLPAGPAPALPFFGEGGALWSNGERHDVPAAVNRTVAPRPVAGGWLVFVGQDEDDMRMSVLAADGGLRDLPARRPDHGMYDAHAVAVSPDGRRVAFRDLVVDLDTMAWSQVPHLPESDAQDGNATEIEMIGFVEGGLVYEGAPFDSGLGTTWLLRDDGSTVPVDPPEGSHISDADTADVAMTYDYTDDESDTCATSWLLHGTTWKERATGCMGQYLGEALAVSPDADWLITDDMPRVWSLADGEWDRVNMPEGVGKAQMDAQMGGAVWEDADSFLLPVSDRWDNTVPIGDSYDHPVQVVRCTVSSGECERAGTEQDVRVTTSMWGTTDLRFAQP